ncbi:MAG: GAF domain-containing protein [Actinobacteria bacterium]|nr:GAF domain-containing protein [Actinomycetota bacterium]
MGTDRSTVDASRRNADAVEPKPDDRTTLLARIGDRLDAQRVELFAFDDDTAQLLGRWTALGMPIDVEELQRIPLDWFPWSLGSVRPAEYLFVRNAGLLPMTTPPRIVGADLAIEAALMIPLVGGSATTGALCVYWRDERQSWESSARELVLDWARRALLPNR